MVLQMHSAAPPFREEASGAIRIGDSRVLLELVVRAFQDGATPEAIVQRYETLSLRDVYATVAYYLRHTSEVDAYLADRALAGDAMQVKITSQQRDLSDLRKRLLAGRSSQG